MREPFHLTIEQIADLTDYQLARIYLRRDPRDSPAHDASKQMSYREVYERTWSRRGLTPEQIEEKWRRDFPDESE